MELYEKIDLNTTNTIGVESMVNYYWRSEVIGYFSRFNRFIDFKIHLIFLVLEVSDTSLQDKYF